LRSYLELSLAERKRLHNMHGSALHMHDLALNDCTRAWAAISALGLLLAWQQAQRDIWLKCSFAGVLDSSLSC
jgi:hypothetical protein